MTTDRSSRNEPVQRSLADRTLTAPGLNLPHHVLRQIRHLSVLLLAVVLTGTTLTVTYVIEVRDQLRETALDHILSIATVICMAGLYLVNRNGGFRLAASGAVLVAVIAIFVAAVPRASPDEAAMLTYLTIPIVLSGLILSVRFTVVGAGYATLRQIADFPIDRLKVDRSFVQQIDSGHGSQAIVAGVVDIANRLDIQVVAEGVETHAQSSQLARLGCRVVQGWFYSRAVDAQSLARVVATGFPPAQPR